MSTEEKVLVEDIIFASLLISQRNVLTVTVVVIVMKSTLKYVTDRFTIRVFAMLYSSDVTKLHCSSLVDEVRSVGFSCLEFYGWQFFLDKK